MSESGGRDQPETLADGDGIGEMYLYDFYSLQLQVVYRAQLECGDPRGCVVNDRSRSGLRRSTCCRDETNSDLY